MSRYNEPDVIDLAQQTYGGRKRRALQAIKRREAEHRNALTLPHKRAAYWRELALVSSPDDLEPGTCQWPWKDKYATQRLAMAALTGMDRKRKGQGLHPYPCRAGHWHLGRLLRRASVAWRAAA